MKIEPIAGDGNAETLLVAYNFGRIDALEGAEPTRFSDRLFFTGPGWDAVRSSYAEGFCSQQKHISEPAKLHVSAPTRSILPRN